MEISFAIVGTAGRKDDGNKLSATHFKAMCEMAEGLIKILKERNYAPTVLVSGGAAWADHVAVKLFLSGVVPKLRLFLPCKFENGAYVDNGIQDFKQNPGSVANKYHNEFKTKTKITSLSDITIAISKGAEVHVANGFWARNGLVAKSDILLAMTFGNKEYVKDGGTAHTVRTYLNRVHREGCFDKSFHYNLNDGKLYREVKVKDEIGRAHV